MNARREGMWRPGEAVSLTRSCPSAALRAPRLPCLNAACSSPCPSSASLRSLAQACPSASVTPGGPFRSADQADAGSHPRIPFASHSLSSAARPPGGVCTVWQPLPVALSPTVPSVCNVLTSAVCFAHSFPLHVFVKMSPPP